MQLSVWLGVLFSSPSSHSQVTSKVAHIPQTANGQLRMSRLSDLSNLVLFVCCYLIGDASSGLLSFSISAHSLTALAGRTLRDVALLSSDHHKAIGSRSIVWCNAPWVPMVQKHLGMRMQ